MKVALLSFSRQLISCRDFADAESDVRVGKQRQEYYHIMVTMPKNSYSQTRKCVQISDHLHIISNPYSFLHLGRIQITSNSICLAVSKNKFFDLTLCLADMSGFNA